MEISSLEISIGGATLETSLSTVGAEGSWTEAVGDAFAADFLDVPALETAEALVDFAAEAAFALSDFVASFFEEAAGLTSWFPVFVVALAEVVLVVDFALFINQKRILKRCYAEPHH
jgi:hypothetical protein